MRPDIHIVARAFDRRHVYQLYQSGTNDIVRETFDSALRSARYSLQALGFSEEQAIEAAKLFAEKDVEGIRRLAAVYDPDIHVSKNSEYVRLAIEIQDELEEAMRGHRKQHD